MSETTTEKPENQTSWRDKTLKVAGYGYTVGDLSMMAAGKLRNDPNTVKGALIWLAGGLATAIYGHPKPERQLELVTQKFESYLHKQNVTIPDDLREQNALLKKPGFVKRCENFLYEHPSEMLNLAYVIGSGFLINGGIKSIQAGEKTWRPHFDQEVSIKGALKVIEGMSKDLWMGSLIGVGALSGLLIKEDKDAPKKAEHGNAFEKAAAYIQEKPLRLTGALYGANNIFTVFKCLDDIEKYKTGLVRPQYFSGLQAGSYILSNVLLTTVTRDRTDKKGLPVEGITALEDAAARVIAAQPAEAQKHLLQGTAELLAKQKGITLSVPEIAQALADRITALTQERLQPAVTQAKWAARVETTHADAAQDISR